MLRLIESKNAAQAKSYYTEGLAREDYYSEGQEVAGRWGGEGALKLGLTGDIKREHFASLCENRHPHIDMMLTQRMAKNRRVGYDINFHCPKSVSVFQAMTGDETILNLFQEAVRATMRDLEADMQTRVRKGGVYADRPTKNMVWGEFIHFTARPVDGVPDPHLHAHMFTFNSTFDETEGRWKAGQFGDLKRDGPYFEALFHARLAKSLSDAGYAITRNPKGWELAGVPPSVIDKFSRRTAEIEREAEQKGITSKKQKDRLGAATRENKRTGLSMLDLRKVWRNALTPDERQALESIRDFRGRLPSGLQPITPKEALQQAVDHAFERRSVQPVRMIQAQALRRGTGSLTVEDIQQEFKLAKDLGNLIVRDYGNRMMCTTREVLAEECALLSLASESRGTCRALNAEHLLAPNLSDEQGAALKHLLTSQDRVMIVRGRAGVGKTTLMKETTKRIEEGGKQLFAFAPSAQASRGLLREEGFQNADTVANLLLKKDIQNQVKDQVIWIDEAGLVGTRTMKRVVELAIASNARLILTGDVRQHAAVERGDALRLLENHGGLKAPEIKRIQRQRGSYREAVHAISEGRTGDGFKQLEALGAIQELTGSERHEQLAKDYLKSLQDGKSALIIAPTHAEGKKVTNLIREKLKRDGVLNPAEETVTCFQNVNLTEAERRDPANYEAHMMVQFQWKTKGFTVGERLPVVRASDAGVVLRRGADELTLPVDKADRFQVFRVEPIKVTEGEQIRVTQNGLTADGQHRLRNGGHHKITAFTPAGDLILDNGWIVNRHYGHLAHGYVSTSHASQGKTVDRVFIAQGDESLAATNQEQFYVSVSRARESVRIYTDSKEDLLKAATESGRRPSALELNHMLPAERDGLFVNRLLMYARQWGKEQTARFLTKAEGPLDKYRNLSRGERALPHPSLQKYRPSVIKDENWERDRYHEKDR